MKFNLFNLKYLSIVALFAVFSAAAEDLSPLINEVSNMPEGSWKQVNTNNYSDVWAPSALRPLYNSGNPDPSKIIGAWSGFAWDSNRGDLLLYGGGHANYSGNDVYRWRGSTLQWERASLPSETLLDANNNWTAIDGVSAAPASAHTYDNNIFLPISDKFLTFGGAAFNNGGLFLSATSSSTSRKTGPYLWDPSKANPMMVGGTTGSHVQRVSPYPEVLGGNMWQNRELWQTNSTYSYLPGSHTEGCTAYAEENGRDVVYVGARLGGGTATSLFKYTINDVSNPSLDTWVKVGGYWDTPQGQTACGYDPVKKAFVRVASNSRPFTFWDVNTPSETLNYEKRVYYTDADGSLTSALANSEITVNKCSLDYNHQTSKFMFWCGDGRVWSLTSPATLSENGWSVALEPLANSTVPGAVTTGTGILGKWKFIPNINAFIGLNDSNLGKIWVYKPIGWQMPVGGNIRPSVALTSPSNGSQVTVGDVVTLAATASDADGSIELVEFYDGSTLLHTDYLAPYEYSWTDAAVGNHVLQAKAYDNLGQASTSLNVALQVLPGSQGTVVLRDGLDGYAGTSDTYLSSYSKTSKYGGSTSLYIENTAYAPLIKFAIYQSEGGPVPNGAVIQSATLSVYKSSVYDLTIGLRKVLCNWSEAETSWNQCNNTTTWSVAGAGSEGADVSAQLSSVYTAWGAGWVNFDVTQSVNDWQTTNNYGWKLYRVSGDGANLKTFRSSEYSTDVTLRPKLEITYSAP